MSTVLIRSGRRFKRFRLAHAEAIAALGRDGARACGRVGPWQSFNVSFDAAFALLGCVSEAREAGLEFTQTSNPPIHPHWIEPFLESVGVLAWSDSDG